LPVGDLLNKLDAFLVTQDVQDLTLESFGKFEQEVKSSLTKVVLAQADAPLLPLLLLLVLLLLLLFTTS
jgi:hypothetical protein